MGLIRPEPPGTSRSRQQKGLTSTSGAQVLQQAKGGHGRRYAAGGGASVVDPRDVDVCAPRGKARSLFQLAGGDILFTEEDLRMQ